MNVHLHRCTALAWFAALCLFTMPASLVAATPATSALGLTDLLRHAERHNPDLVAARARWQATRLRARATRRWPAPTISGAVFARPIETRVGPQRARIGLSVPIPWPSRLARRGDAVLAKATVQRRRIDARLARLEAEIRTPWARRSWLLQIAGWYDAQRTLLVNLEPSVLTRLRVGRATYADAQRLRLMIDDLADKSASARDAVVAIESVLRARAHVPPGTPLTRGGFEADPFDGAAPPAAHTFHSALLKQPAVLAQDAEIVFASAAIRAAQTVDKPNFGVGVDWIVVGAARSDNVIGSGDDALLVKASMQVPIWRRGYLAEVDAARAERRAATASREATLRRAQARVAQLLFALRDARRKRALFSDRLVPRASAALKTVVQAYANGRAAFQSIVELQRQLLGYQVGLSTAERRRVEAQASLEALLAAPLGRFASPAKASLAAPAPAKADGGIR